MRERSQSLEDVESTYQVLDLYEMRRPGRGDVGGVSSTAAAHAMSSPTPATAGSSNYDRQGGTPVSPHGTSSGASARRRDHNGDSGLHCRSNSDTPEYVFLNSYNKSGAGGRGAGAGPSPARRINPADIEQSSTPTSLVEPINGANNTSAVVASLSANGAAIWVKDESSRPSPPEQQQLPSVLPASSSAESTPHYSHRGAGGGVSHHHESSIDNQRASTDPSVPQAPPRHRRPLPPPPPPPPSAAFLSANPPPSSAHPMSSSVASPAKTTSDVHGLPPTPKVHMGACFSKIFNDCPLHINCTASWIHPERRDQYILFGTDEGIYMLNLNELHESSLELIFPRRSIWLYVINNVLMSLSGTKNQWLWRHDLLMLCSGAMSKGRGMSLMANKMPAEILRKWKGSSLKVPDTKGCIKCSAVRNHYSGYKLLCAAFNERVVLMQWWEPRNKFLLLKHVDLTSPPKLNLFEILVVRGQEHPKICVGISPGERPSSLELHMLDMNLNASFYVDINPTSDWLDVICVQQMDKNDILVCYDNKVHFVNMEGRQKNSQKNVNELHFDFKVESLVVLKDSVLAFHKHGMQGRSYRNNEVTQEVCDKSRLFRVLGSDRIIVLESREVTGPAATSTDPAISRDDKRNLYVVAGHESTI